MALYRFRTNLALVFLWAWWFYFTYVYGEPLLMVALMLALTSLVNEAYLTLRSYQVKGR